MEAVKFISDCLAEVHFRLMATSDNLTNDELLWRPAPTANNIGSIVWHLARNEDARITNTGKLDEDIQSRSSARARASTRSLGRDTLFSIAPLVVLAGLQRLV